MHKMEGWAICVHGHENLNTASSSSACRGCRDGHVRLGQVSKQVAVLVQLWNLDNEKS